MVPRIFPIPSTYLPSHPSLPCIFLHHRWKPPRIDRCNWPLLHRGRPCPMHIPVQWIPWIWKRHYLYVDKATTIRMEGTLITGFAQFMSIEQLPSTTVELNYAPTERQASIKRRRALINAVNRVCTELVNPIAGKMSWSHNWIPIRFDYDRFQPVPRDKAPLNPPLNLKRIRLSIIRFISILIPRNYEYIIISLLFLILNLYFRIPHLRVRSFIFVKVYFFSFFPLYFFLSIVDSRNFSNEFDRDKNNFNRRPGIKIFYSRILILKRRSKKLISIILNRIILPSCIILLLTETLRPIITTLSLTVQIIYIHIPFDIPIGQLSKYSLRSIKFHFLFRFIIMKNKIFNNGYSHSVRYLKYPLKLFTGIFIIFFRGDWNENGER